MTEFWHIFTDPHHVAAELAWDAIFDGAIGMLLWPLVKRAVRRHDRKEHGRG